MDNRICPTADCREPPADAFPGCKEVGMFDDIPMFIDGNCCFGQCNYECLDGKLKFCVWDLGGVYTNV